MAGCLIMMMGGLPATHGSGGLGGAQLTDFTFSSLSGTGQAIYTIAADGNVYKTIDGAAAVLHETWLLTGVASNYAVRWTSTLGAPTAGTTGSWLNLGSDRAWSSVFPNTAANGIVEIRNASTLVVVTTAFISISGTNDI